MINDPTSQSAGAIAATYAQQWKPTTAYAAGQPVPSPSGDVVTARTAHTSGASFTAANWNQSPAIASKVRTAAQPRVLPTTANAFPTPTVASTSIGLVGLGANNVQCYVQNPNTLRRSPDASTSLYNMTVPANAAISLRSDIRVEGFYAVVEDPTANQFKLYRANFNTTNLYDPVTWAEVLALSSGELGYGFTVTGISQAILVGE